jgi:hypothetical protein
VYAVHFAARQFSGNAGTAISSSNSNSDHRLVGDLGLALDADRAADAALCAAQHNLHEIRKQLLAYATRRYRFDEQYDPDTGEPLFDKEQALRFREITTVLESLSEELRLQDVRALMLGMTDGMQQQLLKPAGFRQLQVLPVFGTDAGAEVVIQQLELWPMQGGEAAGSEAGRKAVALATTTYEVKDAWQFMPMQVTQVGGSLWVCRRKLASRWVCAYSFDRL